MAAYLGYTLRMKMLFWFMTRIREEEEEYIMPIINNPAM